MSPPKPEAPGCSRPAEEQDLLAIGRVVKTRGLKGELKVASYAESPETFRRAGALYVLREGKPISLGLERVREHGRALLCKFRDLDRIEQVEALVGATLYLRKQDLRPLPAGEYYWYQLIGLEVLTDEGRRLGTIKGILNAGSRDVYVVSEGKREWLIPDLPEVIGTVDIPGGRMIIHPIEGLLEPNDL